MAILTVLQLQHHLFPKGYLQASMGAACVLFFSQQSTPKLSTFWIANTLGAFIGITSATYIPSFAIAAATAIGITNGVMYSIGKSHPPAGATALLVVIGGANITGLGYLFIPLTLFPNLAVMSLFIWVNMSLKKKPR